MSSMNQLDKKRPDAILSISKKYGWDLDHVHSYCVRLLIVSAEILNTILNIADSLGVYGNVDRN
jgi:hypothetical protein